MKEGFQRIEVNKSKYFVHLLHDIESMNHKDWVHKGLYLLELWKDFQFQNLFKRVQREKIHTLIRSTIKEWISRHALRTTTCSNMIENFTQCITAANSYARVWAFISNTSHVSITVIILNTFWTTSLIWITHRIFSSTRALTIITNGIWTTRRWVAGVIIEGSFFGYKFFKLLTSLKLG